MAPHETNSFVRRYVQNVRGAVRLDFAYPAEDDLGLDKGLQDRSIERAVRQDSQP